MRFCSPLKVVKSVAFVAVIVISLYFYLTLPQKPIPRWSRRKHYARHYSGNTTGISHLLYNSREIQDKKILNGSFAELDIPQLKEGQNFKDDTNIDQNDKVTYLYIPNTKFLVCQH